MFLFSIMNQNEHFYFACETHPPRSGKFNPNMAAATAFTFVVFFVFWVCCTINYHLNGNSFRFGLKRSIKPLKQIPLLCFALVWDQGAELTGICFDWQLHLLSNSLMWSLDINYDQKLRFWVELIEIDFLCGLTQFYWYDQEWSSRKSSEETCCSSASKIFSCDCMDIWLGCILEDSFWSYWVSPQRIIFPLWPGNTLKSPIKSWSVLLGGGVGGRCLGLSLQPVNSATWQGLLEKN